MFSKASKQIKKFADWVVNKDFSIISQNCSLSITSFKICGGLGQGKPIFNESEVWFNGDASEHLDHKTFRIYWAKDGKDFCKTARKPYDVLVCFALLTFAEIFPKDAFIFSSDGTMEDVEWQAAVELYESFTVKSAKIPQSLMKDAA